MKIPLWEEGRRGQLLTGHSWSPGLLCTVPVILERAVYLWCYKCRQCVYTHINTENKKDFSPKSNLIPLV